MESAEGLSCFICMFSYLINYSNGLTYYIPEQKPVGYWIGNVAKDENLTERLSQQEFNNLEYYFIDVDNPYLQYFDINSTTSDLSIKTPIDREEVCQFLTETPFCEISIKVAAAGTIGTFFSRHVITINLEDINDNAPNFVKSSVALTFLESDVPGTQKPVDGAVDNDSANFSVTSYKIIPENAPFGVDYVAGSETVRIVIAEQLDRETQDYYTIELVAYDGGSPPLNGSMTVNITVQDTNDNPPVFSQQVYNVTIKENTLSDKPIVQVAATDADIGNNSNVTYSLSEHQPLDIKDAFEMNETTGDLKVKGLLEYAPNNIYKVLVIATDMGDRPQSSRATVHVYVEDTENNPPTFRISPRPSGSQVAEISEYAVVGAAVAHVEVTDGDSDRNGVVSCSTTNPFFMLQLLAEKEYKVNVLVKLDYEIQQKHNVSIFCHDYGVPSLNSTGFFIVNVLDENDNSPVFDAGKYSAHMKENNRIGDLVIQVHASDKDSGQNGKIHYFIRPNTQTDFIVNSESGLLYANKSFDHEKETEIQFEIVAVDGGNPNLSDVTKIVVTIDDINDNFPVFIDMQSTYFVQESDNRETVLGKITAEDADSLSNGYVSYKLVDPNNTLPFLILPDGTLKTKSEMDRENVPKYEFVVVATDNGVEKRLNSSLNVTVIIADVNDNDPILRYPQDLNVVKYITYMTPPQTQVMTIQAYDLDEGKNAQLVYKFTQRNDSQMFQLGRNGEIYVSRAMTEEDMGTYSLQITVSDRGEPSRSVWTRVTVIVLSKNGTALVKPTEEIESQNIVIAVVVVVVTAVMAAAILLIIWIMRRMDLKKRMHAENGHARQPSADQESAGFPSSFDMKVKTLPLPETSHGSLPVKTKVSGIGHSKGIDNPVYPNAPGIGDHGNHGNDNVDTMQRNSDQTLHRLASFKVQQALKQTQNRQWTSQNDLVEPSKDGVPHRQEDHHSDLSADTGTFDSGMGGSVSDTGDARLAQLQQVVRQSGRRGQPPHKPGKPPKILARGRTEAPDRHNPTPKDRPYQSFSPSHMSPAQSPSHQSTSQYNHQRDSSPSKFKFTSRPPSSPTKPLQPDLPMRLPIATSPTKFNIQSNKVNIAQDLLMYKQFQNGLKPPRRVGGLIDDSVDTTYHDDDESTTSGSYYIDNTAEDIVHTPVSDIYV